MVPADATASSSVLKARTLKVAFPTFSRSAFDPKSTAGPAWGLTPTGREIRAPSDGASFAKTPFIVGIIPLSSVGTFPPGIFASAPLSAPEKPRKSPAVLPPLAYGMSPTAISSSSPRTRLFTVFEAPVNISAAPAAKLPTPLPTITPGIFHKPGALAPT